MWGSGKHLHVRIISLKGGVWAHKTSLISALFFYWIYVLRISILSLFLPFSGALGTVLTAVALVILVFHFVVFICHKHATFRSVGFFVTQNYSDFLKRHLHLRNRLLDQGYKKIRLIRSLKKFIHVFRYQDVVEKYSVSAETIIWKCIKIAIK